MPVADVDRRLLAAKHVSFIVRMPIVLYLVVQDSVAWHLFFTKPTCVSTSEITMPGTLLPINSTKLTGRDCWINRIEKVPGKDVSDVC